VAAFSNPAITNGYVFDFAGVGLFPEPSVPTSIIGGSVRTAPVASLMVFDANIDGVPSNQQAFPQGAFYQVDTNGTAQLWRGPLTSPGTIAFYIVDATRLKLLNTNPREAFSGRLCAAEYIFYCRLTEQRLCISNRAPARVGRLPRLAASLPMAPEYHERGPRRE